MTNPTIDSNNLLPSVAILSPHNDLGIISNTVPLGGLYLTSFLLSKKIDTLFFDLSIHKNPMKIVDEIANSQRNVIGLTCTLANYKNTFGIAAQIKRTDPQKKIIVGGPFATNNPELILRSPSIDAVCCGEGEETFLDYILNQEKALGLYLKKRNKLVFTGPRSISVDINDLPFPAFDSVDLSKYHFSFQKSHPISSIMTSRGCPYHCTFCSHTVFGYKWRARSPKNVINELKWQINQLGVNEICVWDDNFTLDVNRTRSICDLIHEEKMKFHWQCSNGIRVDRIDYSTLQKMKNTGCWNISLAPESGDPVVVKKILKSYTLSKILQVRKWLKDLNIFTGAFFILDLPYESSQSFNKTSRFIRMLDPDFISVHKFTPFPKTDIVNELNLTPVTNRGYKSGKLDPHKEKMFRQINLNFYLQPRKLVNICSKVGLRFTLDTVLQIARSSMSMLSHRQD